MNPSRADFVIDLAYGLVIFLSIVLIVTVGTETGIAFGLGALVSYVLHVGWKMARFDPEWMTQEVTENLEETITEEVTETVGDEITETVGDEITETVGEEISETVGEEITENVEKTMTEEVVENVETQVTENVEEALSEETEAIIDEIESVGEEVKEKTSDAGSGA
ncbi:MAG: hypothetical protein ABEH66_03130 [Halobacteriales archaeon]